MTGPPQPPSKSSSEFYHRSSPNFPPSPPRSRPLRNSVPEVPPISNVFSDEFSLEPLSREPSPVSTASSDRTSIGARSRATDDGRSQQLRSPFDDSSEILPEEEMSPPSPELDRRYVPTELASVVRAPSTASSMGGSAPSTTHRSMSTSSRISMPRAMSPYMGQTGPSHPYAMYPQGTAVGRASSISSTSTVRPAERSQVAAPPPQHPYALYSQNTVPEEVLDEPNPPLAPIPLGFPGQEPAFQSQPAPRPDEVGDIVGPDGHTEQLPPYSRYPDGLPPKHEYSEHLGVAGPDNAAVPGAAPVSPDSGVSAQTLLAQQANTAVQDAPRSVTAEEAAVPNDPSGGFKEKLAQKSKRKLCCGVPIWMFLLFGGVLILGGVIGGVIGGLLGSQKGRNDATRELETGTSERPMTTVTPTPSPILDAIPINMDDIQGSMRPLPTNDDFLIPANTLTGESNACVNEDGYETAWQCLSTGLFSFGLHSVNKTISISIDSPDLLDGSIIYGAQRPFLQWSNFTVQLARDATMLSLGPALFFFTPFDKLVVVHEEDFPDPIGGSVSEDDIKSRSSQPREEFAEPGHRPWFCWWNSTLLETFIYINQTTSSSIRLNTTGTTAEGATRTSVPIPTPSNGIASPTRDAASEFFERPMKFEEVRFARDDLQPYCEQRQILDNGDLGHAMTRVLIDEVYTGAGPGISGPYPGTDLNLSKRGKSSKACFCQWLYS